MLHDATPTESPFLDFSDGGLVSMENPRYLSRQLLTYIGNKRALAKHLEAAVSKVKGRVGGRHLSTLDLFAGSGFVARLMKRHSRLVVANDFETYAAVTNRCYLTNQDEVDLGEVAQIIAGLNARADAGESVGGFIEALYAPDDDHDIQPGERAFYTRDNARRLDLYAQAIRELPEPARTLLLGPLLSRASMHANTSGVFKGFYKNKQTGLGMFGGYASNALKRILAPIRLEVPELSTYSCSYQVHQSDANTLLSRIPDVDLAYLDPPYNQHPYGSNYFMLNLLCDYERPTDISRVSGIPTGWQRSGYNVRAQSPKLLIDLIERTPARFLLLSFNAEAFVAPEALNNALCAHGRVEEIVIPYTTFRGSRNLRERSISVNEHLFLLERA